MEKFEIENEKIWKMKKFYIWKNTRVTLMLIIIYKVISV